MSRVRTQKKEVVFPDSLDEYPSQLDAGEKVFLAHQPNFFILPFAFLLLPSEKRRN
jgi:hypothetical protein